MRLLVATDFTPDASGGGPAVVRQMLKDFEGEIHWWSVRSCRMQNGNTCQWGLAGPSAKGSPKGGGAASDFTALGFPLWTITSCQPGKMFPSRRVPRLKAWLMENVWAPLAARSLANAIERVGPECIWVIPHDWSILPLHKVLVSESKISNRKSQFSSWHTTIQDYPEAHHHGAAWGHARVERMAQMQEELYAKAASRDATSLPMLADLEAKTGAKGAQMLHQGLEAADFSFLEQSVIRNPQSAVVKIAYAGTILVPKEFAAFVESLGTLRNSQSAIPDFRIELHFWGAHSYRQQAWFCPEWMAEHGNLSEVDLLAALRECDWGFIPMSLEDNDPHYNRFSFPTKFITYLAAGLPVIAMGHRESSVMKMALNYDVGLSILQSDVLHTTFATSLADPDAKERYRPELLRCAREQFDAEKMRRTLWECWRQHSDLRKL